MDKIQSIFHSVKDLSKNVLKIITEYCDDLK